MTSVLLPGPRVTNRGRRTGRKLDRGPKRVWATPLQALLVAERAALLSGRDEDFTMVVTIAYTGLRWVRRSASNGTTSTTMRSTSSGSCARSAARSTGSRPRTTPTAAPTGNPACPSTSHRSWPSSWTGRSKPSPGSGAPARPSTVAAGTTCSSARTAGIPGAATTPAACSARPATAATSRSPASRPGSPSWTPPRGRASRSRPGRAPPRPRGARHARALRPHFRPDARRPQDGPPGALGGLATGTVRPPRALTRPAARRNSSRPFAPQHPTK